MASDKSGEVNVRLLSHEEQDPSLWQDYVESRPESGPMHNAGWFKVLGEAFSVQPYYLLAVTKEGAVTGIMPLYLSRSIFAGKHLATLQDGILANDANVAEKLFGEAVRILEKVKGGYLLMRGGMAAGGKPDGSIRVVHTMVDTSLPSDALLKTINKKTRWSIRQAAKCGYKFREGVEADIKDFYNVYARNLRRLGTPVISFRAMAAIIRYLGPLCKLFTVYTSEAVVGGMICIANGSGWSSFYAAVDEAAQDEFANYLLYWNVLEWMCERGCKAFDLGRSTPDSGVHHFKHKWSNRDVTFDYTYYGPRAKQQCSSSSAIRSRSSLKQKLWSRLPLPVCNLVGPVLRRRLPIG
jgi:FemAB-related protein (PEP-CTERM system-associated)